MRAVATLSAMAIFACAQFGSTEIPGLVEDAGGKLAAYQSPLETLSVGSDDSRQILQITHQYMMDQVNTATENKSFNRSRGTNKLPMDKIIDPLRDILRQEAPRIQLVRNLLRGTPGEHDWGRVKLRDPKVAVLGIAATLTVTEDTEMHNKYLGNSYYYSIKHTLNFLQINGDWKIDGDNLEDVADISPTPYARGPLKVPYDDASAISPDLARPLDPQNNQAPESLPHGVRIPPNPAERLIDPAPASRPDPYNGNAAADYALKWAQDHNPDYPVYQGDDCTNFASQALFTGGWTEDVPGDWFSHVNGLEKALGGMGASRFHDVGTAWVNSNNLWNYGIRSGRFERVSGAVNLPGSSNYVVPARGDLTFADWRNLGYREHTMVVTSVPGTGQDWRAVEISSHSNSEINRPLQDIFAGATAQIGNSAGIRFYFAYARS